MKNIILGLSLILLCSYSHATTYTVTSASASGAGSFLEAIDNANLNAGADNIVFDIPGTPPHVIPLAVTASISITDMVVIDGSTQPDNGYTGNCPKIQLDAAASDTTMNEFIQINSSDVSIFGLGFRNYTHLYSSLISVRGQNVVIGQPNKKNTFNNVYNSIALNANDVQIGSNIFGCNCDGDALDPNLGTAIIGIQPLNNINITDNLISGNDNGIVLGTVAGSSNNVLITGNLIGTDITGSFGLGNNLYGANLTRVEGLTFGDVGVNKGNVVSSNYSGGCLFIACSGMVLGNFIGTDISGNDTLPNDPMNAVYSTALNFIGSSGITCSMVVGGFGAGEQNVIFGNNIALNMSDSSGIYQVYNNVIGQTLSGLVSPNQNIGVQLYYDTNQVVISSNYVYAIDRAIFATQARNFIVSDNIIGYDVNSNILQLGIGVQVANGESFNMINNIIQNCYTGLFYRDANNSYSGHNQIQDCQTAINMAILNTTCHHNQLDQNALSNNLVAVDLKNAQSVAANDDILPPVIQGSTPDSTWGSALPDALVDLVLDVTLDPAHPQGFDYSIPRLTADASGHWVYVGTLINPNDYTAMQTDLDNNSSGFSERLTLGIENLTVNQIQLYPNPANDYLVIHNNAETNWEHWQIINLVGAVVDEANFINSQNEKINVKSLTQGYYFLKLSSGKESVTQRFIKN